MVLVCVCVFEVQVEECVQDKTKFNVELKKEGFSLRFLLRFGVAVVSFYTSYIIDYVRY